MRGTPLVLACLALPGIAGRAPAAPRADQESVNAAAERGGAWLLQQVRSGLPPIPWAKAAVHSDTSWRDFALYAMLHAGIDPNAPEVVRLVNESLADRPVHTYQAVVRLQALHKYSKLRKLDFSSRFIQTGQFLVDNQGKNGLWGYSEPADCPVPNIVITPSPSRVLSGGGGESPVSYPPDHGNTRVRAGMTQPRLVLTRRGWGSPHDLSNAQYALLGLWVCMNEGIWPPPDCLPLLETYLTENQKDDGGWGYTAKDGSTGSMTAGGLFGLGACLRARGNTNPMSDPRVAKAAEWMGGKLTFSQNPGRGGNWQYYWIYSVERAGALLDTEQFGPHRWYDEGVQYLLGAQQPDGSWGDVMNTGYAILFLRQATRQLVTYSGEHAAPKVFQPDPQRKP